MGDAKTPWRIGITGASSTSGRPVKAAKHERSELGLYWADVVRHFERQLRANKPAAESPFFIMKHRES